MATTKTVRLITIGPGVKGQSGLEGAIVECSGISGRIHSGVHVNGYHQLYNVVIKECHPTCDYPVGSNIGTLYASTFEILNVDDRQTEKVTMEQDKYVLVYQYGGGGYEDRKFNGCVFTYDRYATHTTKKGCVEFFGVKLVNKTDACMVSLGWHSHYLTVKSFELFDEMPDCVPKPTDKPPVGLRPEYLAESDRIKEIVQAMTRFTNAGKVIPAKWGLELSRRITMEKAAKASMIPEHRV